VNDPLPIPPIPRPLSPYRDNSLLIRVWRSFRDPASRNGTFGWLHRSLQSGSRKARKKRARSPPSAFRGLPIFLPGVPLMDTINQLAAVFHLRMYHCRQPSRESAGPASRSTKQKLSVTVVWKMRLSHFVGTKSRRFSCAA